MVSNDLLSRQEISNIRGKNVNICIEYRIVPGDVDLDLIVCQTQNGTNQVVSRCIQFYTTSLGYRCMMLGYRCELVG